MPKAKKNTKKVVKAPAKSVMYNQFFGLLLIGVGVGALIVFIRYILITYISPADVYLVEPSQLIPGMTQ